MKRRFFHIPVHAFLAGLFLAVLAATCGWAGAGRDVQNRLDADIDGGRPAVVHVVVALCDNANQGIVPVPGPLGDGREPRTNLYWGALYGLKTHLTGAAGWERVGAARPGDRRILERVLLKTRIQRGERSVPVYLVADAWDGACIRKAIEAFFRMAAGRSVETIEGTDGQGPAAFSAGGASHLLVYLGHNGLMEFETAKAVSPDAEFPARSAMVLACSSKRYFLDGLESAGAHPLLLTTGLMAPEAYTLDAAVRSWIGAGTTEAVVRAAARAYALYQHCGIGAAAGLFWGAP